MDLSIQFLEATVYNPTILHTINDDNIMSYKISNESYIAWEYLHTKARSCKIRCFGDTWMYENLMTFTNILKDDEDNDRDYIEYTVRLKFDDDISFTGWIKTSTLKRTYVQDANGNDVSTIEFTAYDLLDVIKEGFDYDKTYENVSEESYEIINILTRILRDALIKTNSNIDTDEKTDEYLNINSTSTPLELVDFTVESFGWNSIIPLWYTYVSSWSDPYKIVKLIQRDGLLYLVLWKGYLGEVVPGTYEILVNGVVRETDYATYIGHRSLSIYRVDGLSVTKVYGTNFIPTTYTSMLGITAWPGNWIINYDEVVYEHIGIDEFFLQDMNNISPLLLDTGEEITLTTQFSNVNSITYNGLGYALNYFINSPYEELKVNGNYDITSIHFIPTDEETDEAIIKASDILKQLLMLKDLTMYSDNNGVIQIKNKRSSNTNRNIIIIGENDLISYVSSQLKFDIDEILSLFTVSNNAKLVTIDEFLEDLLIMYYKDLLGTNILDLEILNNDYNLNLGDTIQLNDVNYIVYSIEKIPSLEETNRYFSYKVKAWEIK